jgi:hypothetical protein
MASNEIQFHKIWIDQCEATEGIRDRYGLQRALDYLVGEKLFIFVHAAEREPDLCLSLFPWAKFREHKAAVKMHTLLDLHGNIPTFMFIINPQGQLIYDGAIDDEPTTEQSDIAGATNYVRAALEESMAGKPVAVTASQPYGCSVKYAVFV